jgi:3-oxoadipate enol-lactonase
MPHQGTTQTLDVPNGRLAYDVAGQGPPIVLIHEAIADRRVWDREFPVLARDHRVVRFDLRGYGESPPSTGAFWSVRDLHALIQHLKLERPLIVGASMGGALAIDYALAYPNSVRGLLLVAPGVSGMDLDMFPDAKAALEVDDRESTAAQNAWTQGKPDEAFEHLRTLWGAALTGPALEHFRTMARANMAEIFDSPSGKLEKREAPPAARRLGSVDAPTLVLVGDRDNPFQEHVARYIVKNLPGAKLLMVPGGDHLLNLSRPDAFDRALAGFLKETRAKGP